MQAQAQTKNVVAFQSGEQPIAPADTSTTAMVLDESTLSKMLSFAKVMASSTITIPKHLQGKEGDCLAITMQAMQWGMNPFAVAQKTHVVNGALGYEAQLVAAVINVRAPISGRLDYEWFGDWAKVNGKTCSDDNVGVFIWATFKGETEPRRLRLSMAQVGGVRNSPNWASDPRQQLAYLAAKKWSRLHCPDVILGVYTPDELDNLTPVDVTPAVIKPGASKSDALKQSLKTKPAAPVVSDLEKATSAIESAKTLDELAACAKGFSDFVLTEGEIQQVKAAYKARKAALQPPDPVQQSFTPTPEEEEEIRQREMQQAEQ